MKKTKQEIKDLKKKYKDLYIKGISSNNPIVGFNAYQLKECKEAFKELGSTRIEVGSGKVSFLSQKLFENITEIRLTNIENIKPIEHLHKLVKLESFSNQVAGNDIGIDFSNFPELQDLNFDWIKNSFNFDKLSKIKKVRLTNLDLNDLTFLGKSSTIKEFHIYESSILSLKGIEELSSIEELSLMNVAKLESIEGIDKTNIKKLCISGVVNAIDLTSIGQMKSLEELELSYFSSIDLDFLRNLKSLKKLKIMTKEVKNENVIAGLENIHSMELIGFSKVNLESILTLKSIENLSLSSINKMDAPLNKITQSNLKSIQISNVEYIDNVDFLSDLSKLEEVFLTPWNIHCVNGFLPLTSKLLEIDKLDRIIEWEDVTKHLDNKGLEFYKGYFGDSKLEFIAKQFDFDMYDYHDEPYTVENCKKVTDVVRNLISKLIKVENDKDLCLTIILKAVDELNKIDEQLELFETGEREYLHDTFESIFEALNLNDEIYLDRFNNQCKW